MGVFYSVVQLKWPLHFLTPTGFIVHVHQESFKLESLIVKGRNFMLIKMLSNKKINCLPTSHKSSNSMLHLCRRFARLSLHSSKHLAQAFGCFSQSGDKWTCIFKTLCLRKTYPSLSNVGSTWRNAASICVEPVAITILGNTWDRQTADHIGIKFQAAIFLSKGSSISHWTSGKTCNFQVIYQKRVRVFHQGFQTPRN